MRGKKGVVFTLDAILGFVIILVLIFFPLVFLTSSHFSPSITYSSALAKDVSAVLLETDLMYDAIISENYTSISKYLNESVPSQFGSIVTVTNESGTSTVISGMPCVVDSHSLYKRPIYANNNYIYEVNIC